MFRKFSFVFTIITILSMMVISGPALAKNGSMTTWETVFDPGPFMIQDADYFIHAVEEFKGQLYAVAAGTDWFGKPATAGRLFRSPDGKTWEPVTDLGFGLGAADTLNCPMNYYETAWDMIVFGDQLYLIPFDNCYERPGVIMRSSDGTNWESVVTAADLGISWYDTWYGQFHKLAMFNGMLYANMDLFDPATEFTSSAVFRSPTGNPGTWVKVQDFPGWSFPGTFQTFKGALYLASDGVFIPPDWMPAPDQIWRTFDGVNWEMVVGDGFGNAGTDGMGAFAVYKGYLYVGEGNADVGAGDPGPYGYGGQIWRTKDGSQWEQVITGGFGNPLDEKVDGLITYEGQLYAWTVNWTDGGSVYRTKDAVSWERVNDPGWGNPLYLTTHLASDQVVFKDDLYMGVVGPSGVLLKLVHPDK